MPRPLAVLGSTGSIGVSALKVVGAYPQYFRVEVLAGGRNTRLLAEQAACFRPPWLAVLDGAAADALRSFSLGYRPQILAGPEAYARLAALPEVSVVLSAQAGTAGLRATLAAVKDGKVVCLANKESLVLAGEYIRVLCARAGAAILPVDSEHNAIFQALAGREAGHVRRVLLTASGGPFRGLSREALAAVTPEQALRHPNWSMGAKITVDSATLLNKGMELIEACRLYGLPLELVGVVLHPQSLVHSLVEFVDGSFMAQLGAPDMRMPIAHCLAWPHCPDASRTGVEPLDLARAGSLTFESPDEEAFPCLELARRALRFGRGMPAVLAAAGEAAVELFLAGNIAFPDIPVLIAEAMDAHEAGQGCRRGEGQCCAPAPVDLPEDGDDDAFITAVETVAAEIRNKMRERALP